MCAVIPITDNSVCHPPLAASFLQMRLAAACRLTDITTPAPTDHTTTETILDVGGRSTLILPIDYHFIRGGFNSFHLFHKNSLTVISGAFNEVGFQAAETNKRLPELLKISRFGCRCEQVAFMTSASVYPGFTLARTAESTSLVITDG